MADERYDLVFRGDIRLEHSLDQVKQRLQKLLKADAAQIERLFSGRPVVLKRGLEPEAAQKYLRVLEQAGARARLVPSAPKETRGDRPTSASRPGASSPSTQTPTATRVPAHGGFSLAPPGAPLLKPDERPNRAPVVVNIQDLSLRPAGGDLLDPAERSNPQSPEQPAPDYGLSDPGADLLTPAERRRPDDAEVAVEDWGLAEVGEDILSEQERAKPAPAPVLTESLSLAPEGDPLRDPERAPEPKPPDTSGLSLAD